MAEFTIALDEHSNRVNISAVDEHKKYKCINCGEPMMAVLGKEREHHFRHQVISQTCKHDYWLHKEILNILCERLDSNEAFIIELQDRSIDLQNIITYGKEKKFNGFVPDILLTWTNDIIFLEICVSSPCSEEKINSGYKIIEICINDDQVINELNSGNITTEGEFYQLKFYNFPENKPDIQEESDKTNSLIDIPVPKDTWQELTQSYILGDFRYYFVLHNNGTFNVFEKSMARTNSTDKLVIGVNMPENFVIAIGRKISHLKGFTNIGEDAESYIHIDLNAVQQYFTILYQA